MSCYKPLHAFPVEVTSDGTTHYKIFGRDVSRIRDTGRGFKAVNGIDVRASDITAYIDIPCRRCIGCRLDYSRQWADRLMIELQRHESAWFVTLTYDEKHLPHAINSSTGEIEPYSTLSKRDCQLFMKRLRKAHAKKYPDLHLMYYLAGEYGDTTARAHYHAIIFDLMLDDLQIWTQRDGFTYYVSDWLSSVWQNGRAIVARVTWDTCAYTARYILKKQFGKGSKEWYIENGLQPEFSLVSTKPAIAKEYFLEKVYPTNQMFHRQSEIYISTDDGGKRVRFPKYWDRLFENLEPEEMSLIKEERKEAAQTIQDLKLLQTSKSYYDYLEDEEINKLAQIQSLRRRTI